MEILVILIVILAIAAWLYNAGHKSGKREGSRKGYGVGFDRGRKSRKNQSGCLLFFVVLGTLITAASAAFAYLR